MSEKVLGFYKKDAKVWDEIKDEATFFINEQVSVRLASESVDLKELREWIEKNKRLREFVLIDDLIEWAEKEAKKK